MKPIKKKLFIGSDHAGFSAKNALVEFLKKNFTELDVQDLGCHSLDSVDYPDFALLVGKKVVQENGFGILVCGSGIGMCISANKVAGVRAAGVWDVTTSRLSREHNDANIVCLGSRVIGALVLEEIVRVFITTEFLGGRHQNRIAKIDLLDH